MTPEERTQLQEDFIYEVADDMDHKTAFNCLIHYLTAAYDKYSDEELVTEVKDTYPHLLEN